MFTDYTVTAEVTADGKLELLDREAFSRAMRHFKRGRVTVRVEVDRGKRTSQQNRYYRLILGLICDHTGDDPEYLHEHFKRTFLQPKTGVVFGHEIEIWTTTLEDYDAFWEYVEKIRRFVRDEPTLNIVTPEPDPSLRGKSRHAKRSAA
jgi:hypothetical protein